MKYNLLLPIAGNGQIFSDEGYELPKPLIPTNGKTILERSLEAVNLEDCNLIFVVRQDHIDDFSIDNIISKKYPNKTKQLKQAANNTIKSRHLAIHIINQIVIWVENLVKKCITILKIKYNGV